jgi:magnesium chelatase family protein
MLEKVYGNAVFGIENITEVIDFFDGKTELEQTIIDVQVEFNKSLNNPEFDFANVKG